MPIIPLPIRSNPLPDAAAPVLDRERRPTVDTQAQQQAVAALVSGGKMPELPMSLADPYSAMGAVGRAVSQAGDIMGALAIKRQEAVTDRQVSDADGAMQTVFQEFDTWRQTHPEIPPEKWGGELDQHIATAREKILGREGLTPGAKQEIASRFNRWSGLARSGVQATADKTIFQQAKDANLGDMENAIQSQNAEAFIAAQHKGLERGWLDAQRAEHEWNRFREVGKRKEREARAAAYDSAENRVTAIAAGSGQAEAVKIIESGVFDDLDESARERLRGVARQVGNQRSAEAIDIMATGMASGEINSEAKIVAFAEGNPHVPLLVREQMIEELKRRDLRAEAEDRRVNGVANSVELYQEINDLVLTGDDLKDKGTFYAMLSKIKRQVDESKDGTLSKMLHQKFWGTAPELKPREVVMKNFRDELASFYHPETGNLPWLKKEWQEVEERNDRGKPVKKWREVRVEDANRKRQALDAQTRVLTELERKAKLNPEKFQDIDAYKEEFLKLLPEGMAGGVLQRMRERISQPGGAVGKVTSYGYANDSTPDSNSAAGIGAWAPEAEQAKIKRGEPSEYRLREGDIAVSPDVERAFRIAGVKPGGEVMVTLANGETRRVRWMDRTAQDEDVAAGRIKGVSKPLRGRFDFYSPGSKHRLDGVQVVGWKPI